jgi:alkylated DNA nucleotide flippase Atl1
MVAARSPNLTRVVHAARPTATAKRKRPAATRPGKARLSWESKLRADLVPRVVDDRRTGGRLLLPTAMLLGEVVVAVPPGRVMTIGQVRRALAERFGADSTCPLMTGIFAATLAGAVGEDLAHGRVPRWPIWRLVRDDGTLHPKWPLDALYRATMLRAEGVRLTRRNGNWAALDTHQC